MPKLKKFLQDRGITVNSYLKPGLVAIACAVEEMNLPLQYQTTEAEEKLRNIMIHMQYRKLVRFIGFIDVHLYLNSTDTASTHLYNVSYS